MNNFEVILLIFTAVCSLFALANSVRAMKAIEALKSERIMEAAKLKASEQKAIDEADYMDAMKLTDKL